jgi:hypothetical protein
MTTAPDPLDLRARQLHASALAHTSPATLARLRQARQAAHQAGREQPARGWRLPWLAGGAIAAALVFAVIPRQDLVAPDPAVAASTAPAADVADAAAPLQEDPGFYLWLASADAPALALE